MIPPVSVCHPVSTTGQRASPTTSWYQRQASGLIGSPTLPRRRSDLREVLRTQSSPSRISARIAVAAVYRIVTECLSLTCDKREWSGKVGPPQHHRSSAHCP